MSERFDWHPEPDLIDFHDPASRVALEQLGDDTWSVAMDYLYDHAIVRPVGPLTYPELRQAYFGASGLPGPAPAEPSTAAEVLQDIRDRMLPYAYNAHHLRSFSYFTTPPLPISAAGDALAAWLHQSVDVFHAGPIGTLVEEEVATWLRDLVGVGSDGWAVLTSGGVMANLMAMTVMRDIHSPNGSARTRRRAAGSSRGSRVYCSDQAHFSIRRALDLLGFPVETLRVIERTTASGCRRPRLPTRSRRTARLACSRSGCARSAARPTPARSTRCPTSPTSLIAKSCGSTSMRRTAGRRCCPLATPAGSRGWIAPTR